MRTEKKLNELINSELKNQNDLSDDSEVLLLNILAMVQTLSKDYKLKELAATMQTAFPEYGTMI